MWRLCKDGNNKDEFEKACWEDGIKIILQSVKEKKKENNKEEDTSLIVVLRDENSEITKEEYKNLKQKCAELGFEIADVIVYEWKRLLVKVKSEDKKVEKVYFGEKEAEKLDGLWLFTFENYLGKSFIRVKFEDGQEVQTDPIEVISKKTPLTDENDPLYYPSFLSALIDGILKHLSSRPLFSLSSPTGFATIEYSQAPNLILILHILAHYADTLIQALQTIYNNPYRKLKTQERWVYISEATNVDVDTILMIFHHPEHLHKAQTGGPFGSLAEKLQGYVPERVYQREVVETLDNSENRFIKHLLNTIIFFCDQLKEFKLWEKAKSHYRKLRELEDYVRYLRASSLFADVGDMTIFPVSSQVLLKRDGYRECLEIYRRLQLSRIPVFDEIKDAIDNRNIDRLYEYWCFFELSKRLAEAICERGKFELRFEIVESEEGGLKEGKVRACLGNGYELGYNKYMKSYSEIPLRPDFVLAKKDSLGSEKSKIIFDAKFRFDIENIKIFENKDIADLEKELSEKEDLATSPKTEDILKMHTYRDTIKECKSALIVYPGKEGRFYKENEERVNIDSKELSENFLKELLKFSMSGVGAIALRPED